MDKNVNGDVHAELVKVLYHCHLAVSGCKTAAHFKDVKMRRKRVLRITGYCIYVVSHNVTLLFLMQTAGSTLLHAL